MQIIRSQFVTRNWTYTRGGTEGEEEVSDVYNHDEWRGGYCDERRAVIGPIYDKGT